MGKNDILGIGYVNQNKVNCLINSELIKTRKNLSKKNLDNIFNIKYKGYEFNCLPFLLNGSGYYDSAYRSMLISSISKNDMITEPLQLSELKNIKGLDMRVLDSLIPALSDEGLRLLGAYQYKCRPRYLVQILYCACANAYNSIVDYGAVNHFKYCYEGICNTQAFCYYVGVLWLMSLSPMLHSLCNKELRHMGFDDLISSLLPEDSIHFKYIKGELTSDELYNEYTKERYSDGSSICLREIMSNNTEGKYNGEDFNYRDLGMCKEIYDNYTMNEGYRMNMHIAYRYLFDGTYEQLNNEIESQTKLKEREFERAVKNGKRVDGIRAERNALESQLADKDKEILDLKAKLNLVRSTDSLEAEIKALRNEIDLLKSDNTQLFNERALLKQTISSQIKQLKSLNASVDVSEEESIVFDETLEETTEVPFETIISRLKSNHITYIGCDDNSVDVKLRQYGLNNITQFNMKQRTLGKCDAIVVFSIRCHHADVYRAEKLCSGKDIPIIYVNCTNVDKMLTAVYNCLYKE